MEWVFEILDWQGIVMNQTILAAQPQPAENAPGVSRRIPRSLYLHCCPSGLLGVAVPVQIQTLTHSTWQVGLIRHA